MKHLEKVKFLLSMIFQGVKDNDKDQIRSHLEDLSYYLAENNLIGE
jgi:hypothetical protein